MRTRPWNRAPVGIVVFLCSTFVVRADETEAPAGTRSLGPLPFQLILPREYLLGDWYGTRTWLENHSVTPTLTFVTDSLGNPTGGTEQGFTTANNLGLDLNFVWAAVRETKGKTLEQMKDTTNLSQALGTVEKDLGIAMHDQTEGSFNE